VQFLIGNKTLGVVGKSRRISWTGWQAMMEHAPLAAFAVAVAGNAVTAGIVGTLPLSESTMLRVARRDDFREGTDSGKNFRGGPPPLPFLILMIGLGVGSLVLSILFPDLFAPAFERF
jgi:hypothetical protein